MIVRFSTVIHEHESSETLRDPRGFAVKFYMIEGNFDLVGNNIPVFFICDGIKVCLLGPYTKIHSSHFEVYVKLKHMLFTTY